MVLDGDTALVSAPYKTVGSNSGAGVVYVFARSGKSWSQQAEIKDPNPAANDNFGWSLAISGDTALIDASKAVVYVFTRSGTSWSQQTELSESDGAELDNFGASMTLSGDTALVGAPGKAVGGQENSGVTYVFTRSGTSWSQQAELTASDAAAGEWFGNSVALDGNTALVSAPYKTVGSNNSAGVVYVFTRSGTSWLQQSELTASDATAGDFFGTSMSLSGDTALVSARNKTVGGKSGAGAVYVFTRSATSWLQQAETKDPNPAPNDNFGCSLALSDDTALVGAYDKTVGGMKEAGAAYIFTRTDSSWSQQAELSEPWITPKITLQLRGLKSGAVRLGESVTARGTVKPASLKGSEVILFAEQKKKGGYWVWVKSVTCKIGAAGVYGGKYKPAKRGTYLLRAEIAETTTHAATKTKWLTFKVR